MLEPEGEPSPDTWVVNLAHDDYIRDAFVGLPDRLRNIVVLDAEGYTYKEIARIMRSRSGR